MEPLHFGRFGGLPVQILYAVMGLTAGFLSISGYAIYAIRTRRRGHRIAAVDLHAHLAKARFATRNAVDDEGRSAGNEADRPGGS